MIAHFRYGDDDETMTAIWMAMKSHSRHRTRETTDRQTDKGRTETQTHRERGAAQLRRGLAQAAGYSLPHGRRAEKKEEIPRWELRETQKPKGQKHEEGLVNEMKEIC